MLENRPRAVAGIVEFSHTPTLDKTMSDRKHLVSTVSRVLAWRRKSACKPVALTVVTESQALL
jgi:hypothetical protein